MALRLKKKTIAVLSVSVLVLSLLTTTYIIWRIGVDDSISSEESEASSCASYPAFAGNCPSDQVWDKYRWCCVEKGGGDGGGDTDQCSAGSQCPACTYPKVAYCTSSTHWCSCKTWSDPASGCKSNPKCSPPDCPAGWESCGVSGGSGLAGCTKKTNCTKACAGCANKTKVYRYCKKVDPTCGDGILGNTPGEKCERGDPVGVIYTWDECDQTICDLAPSCGDGILGNTEGEKCELGDPDGVTCLWDECNQDTCTCPDPICGDGILGNTEGEECELGDPDGVSCSWANCEQSTCSCPEVEEPICGDGILGNTEGEECELNDPDGVSCQWDSCDQDSCTCEEEIPELPETGIFNISDIALTASLTMVLYGLVMGIIQYVRGGKDRQDKGILRRLRL